MGWLFAGVELVVGIEPYDVEYIANEKAVYAAMLIARYGKLIRRIALELLVKVGKPVRLRGCTPVYTVRFESRVSVCRKLKRCQAGYIFKAFQHLTKVSPSLAGKTKLSMSGIDVLERETEGCRGGSGCTGNDVITRCRYLACLDSPFTHAQASIMPR